MRGILGQQLDVASNRARDRVARGRDHRIAASEQHARGLRTTAQALVHGFARRLVHGQQRRFERREERRFVLEPRRRLDQHLADQPVISAQPVLTRVAEHPPRHAEIRKCGLVVGFALQRLERASGGGLRLTGLEQVTDVEIEEARVHAQRRMRVREQRAGLGTAAKILQGQGLRRHQHRLVACGAHRACVVQCLGRSVGVQQEAQERMAQSAVARLRGHGGAECGVRIHTRRKRGTVLPQDVGEHRVARHVSGRNSRQAAGALEGALRLPEVEVRTGFGVLDLGPGETHATCRCVAFDCSGGVAEQPEHHAEAGPGRAVAGRKLYRTAQCHRRPLEVPRRAACSAQTLPRVG